MQVLKLQRILFHTNFAIRDKGTNYFGFFIKVHQYKLKNHIKLLLTSSVVVK